MRVNLIDPARARQLAEYTAIRKLELGLVRCATPTYYLAADGSVSLPDYSASRPTCPICTLVRARRWRLCALHDWISGPALTQPETGSQSGSAPLRPPPH